MATREFLHYLKEAHRGHAQAQLMLGKTFLRGGSGFAPNIVGALLWLSKAARQGLNEALHLICEHIPPEIARQHPSAQFIFTCYKEAGINGSQTARWHYVQWVLTDIASKRGSPVQENITSEKKQPTVEHANKVITQKSYQDLCAYLSKEDADLALSWLRDLANSGLSTACWLLAQALHQGHLTPADPEQAIYRAQLAAQAGEPAAVRWLAHQALNCKNKETLLLQITPLLPELLQYRTPTREDAELLFIYAHHFLEIPHSFDHPAKKLAIQALHRAARAGLPQAQFHYGLWLGQLTSDGQRRMHGLSGRNGSLKKSAQWLTLAAKAGVAEAWYVLAMLYRRTQFSQYNIKESNHYLLQAAQLEHAAAQLMLGRHLWRSRKRHPDADVQACYWFWRSAQQGNGEACTWLCKIAQSHPNPAQNNWGKLAQASLQRSAEMDDLTLLVQRVQVAHQFNLNKAEMLLLDLVEAKRDHCLVVDIQHISPRSSRRLILVETPEQHATLIQAAKIFSENELAVANEGNYRQRRYRFEKLLLVLGAEENQNDRHNPNSNNNHSGTANNS